MDGRQCFVLAMELQRISQPFFEIGTSVPIYVELWYVSTWKANRHFSADFVASCKNKLFVRRIRVILWPIGYFIELKG